PVIPVSARKKTGLEVLMHAVAHHKDIVSDKTEHHHKSGAHRHDHHSELALVYTDELEDKIDRVSDRLLEKYPEITNLRWYAIKTLERDEDTAEKYPVDISDIEKGSLEAEFTKQKFDFIEEVIEECLVNKEDKAQSTDRIDKVLTHRVWGVPIFFGIMALVFLLTFTLGDAVKGIFETVLDGFSAAVLSWLTSIGTADWLVSLIVDGIIAGVGGILTFLPNIFILFVALAFLEDSGYMSRVAYVMDGIMGSLGLSGRAFIPMLLGFGCTVPAVMASRTLEDPKDRLKTIIVTPFMSCSARLPVYVLLSEMFFGKWAPLAALSMYALGLLVAITVAKIMSVADKNKTEHSLLIELPEYKAPSLRTVAIYVWEKVKDYLSKAGTVIFIASIILWFVLNVGPDGMTEDMGNSFGAYLGKMLAPILRPCGLGLWQIAVALIAGIAAKEVVVSSMSVLFGITNITSAAGMAGLSTLLSAEGFTALNAYALMAFVLLYIPCAATLGTIRNETKSTKTMLLTALFQLFVAWLVSAIIYNVGSLIF
ncbi:MAG: ferrous iron transport protein B, partial [Clostridia bacterium]|nr:ferrous iron transport protein B [Clostridia bacterium]